MLTDRLPHRERRRPLPRERKMPNRKERDRRRDNSR